MNGFAAEGFANGLVSGLEAVNKLADSAHRRQALDEENAYKRKYFDSQAHKEEMEAQKLETERQSKERQEMAPQLISIGQRVINGEDLTPNDMDMLQKSGAPLPAIADDGYVNSIKDTMDLIRSGKVKPDDPLVTQTMSPILTHKLQRNIGGVSIDPNGNIPIRTVSKEFAGLAPNPKDPNSFGVRVRVTGVDADGNTRSYEDLASQHGTSDPSDPYAFFTTQQLEGPFAATLAMNEGLRKNPKNRELFQQWTQNAAIDPETQSKIGLHNAQIATEGSRQEANSALASERKASAGLSSERSKSEENRRGMIDARTGYYDRGNRPKSDKAKEPKPFDESLADKQANRYRPAPRDKYTGKEKITDEHVKAQSEYKAMVRDAMQIPGVTDQTDAARLVEKGDEEQRTTSDGRKIKGRWVTVQGKKYFISAQ